MVEARAFPERHSFAAFQQAGVQIFLIVVAANPDPAFGQVRDLYLASRNKALAGGNRDATKLAPLGKPIDDYGGVIALMRASILFS
jgi:hypothetical protein